MERVDTVPTDRTASRVDIAADLRKAIVDGDLIAEMEFPSEAQLRTSTARAG